MGRGHNSTHNRGDGAVLARLTANVPSLSNSLNILLSPVWVNCSLPVLSTVAGGGSGSGSHAASHNCWGQWATLRKGWDVGHLLDKHVRHCLLQCAVCQPLTGRFLEMNKKMFILRQGRMSCAKALAAEQVPWNKCSSGSTHRALREC